MARHERRVPYAGLIAEATEPSLSKGYHAPTCERADLITQLLHDSFSSNWQATREKF